jgi:large subunit ribosomal protein L21
MYAIIRAGGKQAKVHEGDVIDVERIKGSDKVSFTPLLIVADDGTVISDAGVLGKSSVSADVIGESAGPKVDIFKYKNKTGYRRRQGHRQKYTTIKVTAISPAGGSKKKAAKAEEAPKAAKAKEAPKAAKAEEAPKATKAKPAPKAAKAKEAPKAAKADRGEEE